MQHSDPCPDGGRTISGPVIEIIGAEKHNLKNISLKIPKQKLVCITGPSGSGKSSLAYDTLFQEGQRKYLASLSVYARQFIKSLEKPEVRSVRGISPTISIHQEHSSFYHNSTVGTISQVSHYLRLLFARTARARCPGCRQEITNYSDTAVSDFIFETFKGCLVYIFAPVVKHRKGSHAALFETYSRRGFLKALVNGRVYYMDEVPSLKRTNHHDIAIQIDAVKVRDEKRRQVKESIALASFESGGEVIVMSGGKSHFFSHKLYCPDCGISLPEPEPATFSLNSPIGVCAGCGGRGVDGEGTPCETCLGSGYNEWARSFYFRGKTIHDLGEMEVDDLLAFFRSLRWGAGEGPFLEPIIPQVIRRLEAFARLNLGYITLNRKINTLSGGELQRTRLVSQIGFGLSGIIYILDEPSIGMHMAELRNLIDILRELTEKDNTVIVVEHDAMTIRASDFIVDLGPGAGGGGGELVYCGWYRDFPAAATPTADYISGRKTVQRRASPPCPPHDAAYLELTGVSINNLRNASVRLPLGALTVVTGVSGSGKSSLIIDALYPIVRARLEGREINDKRLSYDDVRGLDTPGRIMMVTQTAIGQNARSCPATYINIMPVIRELFAGLPGARVRGYPAARFSFNVAGGRCESCKGLGYKKLEMDFLPEMEVPCPVCGGKRFNSETLRVRYRDLSIAGVLGLTADGAHRLFQNIPRLAGRLKMLSDVGLGYLELGQSSVTLSGGESQRIKLTRELSRKSSGAVIYVLDEPTVGLHPGDIDRLLGVLRGLIARGHTVVVIEHNLEIIKAADYLIDLGPGGGRHGGQVLYQGEPAGLPAVGDSVTGRFLGGRE